MWYNCFLLFVSSLNSLWSILLTTRINVLNHNLNHRNALLRIPQWFSIPHKIDLCPLLHGCCIFSASLLILYHKNSPFSSHEKSYARTSNTACLKGNSLFSQIQIYSSARILNLRYVTTTRQKPDSCIRSLPFPNSHIPNLLNALYPQCYHPRPHYYSSLIWKRHLKGHVSLTPLQSML